jgi:hypothetical protein
MIFKNLHRHTSIYVIKIQGLEMGIVAQAYNPSYVGNEDQEDCGSKPARVKSL